MAAKAIRAARCRAQWGRDATLRYLRNNNIPRRLYQLACALEGEN